MKRTLAIALTAVLCAVLMCVPAFAADDPYYFYERAMKNFENVRSVEMDIDMSGSITAAGESIDFSATGRASQITHNKTEAELAMEMTMELLGQTVKMNTYYKDGYMYQNVMGQKLKTPLDMQQMLAQSYGIETDLEEAMFENATVSRVLGGHLIRTKISGDALNTLMAGYMASAYESMGLAGTEMELGDMAYSILVDTDFNVRAYGIQYGATVTAEGETVQVDYSMDCTILSTNRISAIQYPADLDTYAEAADANADAAAGASAEAGDTTAGTAA